MNTREKMYCAHCDIAEACDRKHCTRKALFKNDVIIMVEPKEFDRYRIPEKVRAFRESTLTKKEMQIKNNF